MRAALNQSPAPVQHRGGVNLPGPVPGVIYIYALKCPDTGQVRYVGKAVDLKKRFALHLWDAQHKTGTHRRHWLRKLASAGKQPLMEVIEVCNDDNWVERERFFIQHYRQIGDITNIADGGEGFTSEQVKKMWLSPAFKENFSKKRLGVACPLEVRNKIACTLKGRKQPDEHTEKKRGRTHCDNHKARISAGLKASYAEGRKKPVQDSKKCRKINRYSANGEWIDSFPSFRGMCRELGWSGSTIQRALKDGKEHRAIMGYIIKYAD